YKLDDSESVLIDTDDPVLMGNKKHFWVPDATFGVYFTDNRSYAGITVTDLLGSGIKLGNDPIKDHFSSLRNFNLLLGTNFNLNSEFSIEPSALLRINSLGTYLDLNTQLEYLDSYWFGLSYRTNKSLIVMAGINVDMFRFAYAYDASFGAVKTYSSGSHEIILGVRFGDTSTRRFRWIRKDSMEFGI
ncbi:MAG: PorP/SprF family type IX secretion system membrane protein, partial [Bacteroidales bacterium]|nr:PorP/SprF family type IX secretion system membrane protein [Bacteroidales bacterium]